MDWISVAFFCPSPKLHNWSPQLTSTQPWMHWQYHPVPCVYYIKKKEKKKETKKEKRSGCLDFERADFETQFLDAFWDYKSNGMHCEVLWAERQGRIPFILVHVIQKQFSSLLCSLWSTDTLSTASEILSLVLPLPENFHLLCIHPSSPLKSK